MATIEEVVKKIQIKFRILDLVLKENEKIISRNKVNELVKQGPWKQMDINRKKIYLDTPRY